MFLVASLAPFVFLATKAAANPLFTRDPSAVSMNITKRINLNNNGTLNVVQRDQARLAIFGHQSGASNPRDTTPDISLVDSTFVYVANTAIGSPPSYCEPCQFLPGGFLYAQIRRTHR
jgi:hypothetical protein